MTTPQCSRCLFSDHIVKPIDQWKHVTALSSFLDQCYYKFLCEPCVQEMNKTLIEVGPLILPRNLIIGDHYYIENGKWVFTEKYHLLKNYCCHNECRNCPYGFKN